METPEQTAARRFAKRTAGVQAVKKTPEYIVTMLHHGARPDTPDPSDEKMSKRTWEKSMMNWRAVLRAALREIRERGSEVP